MIESNFMIEAIETLESSKSLRQKQFDLESLSLKHEEHFIKEAIKHLNESSKNSSPTAQILIKLFSQGFPVLQRSLNDLTLSLPIPRQRHLKDSSPLAYRKARIALLLSAIGIDRVCNIIFHQVIQLVCSHGEVEEIQVIKTITNTLIKRAKAIPHPDFPLKSANKLEKLPASQNSNKLFQIFLENREDLLPGTEVENAVLGQTLCLILLDTFRKLFVCETVFVGKNDQRKVITLNPQYLSSLVNMVFNPIALPMVSPPRLWTPDTQGGYLNPLYSARALPVLITNNPSNKLNANANSAQLNSVNFLNHQRFTINREALKYLLQE